MFAQLHMSKREKELSRLLKDARRARAWDADRWTAAHELLGLIAPAATDRSLTLARQVVELDHLHANKASIVSGLLHLAAIQLKTGHTHQAEVSLLEALGVQSSRTGASEFTIYDHRSEPPKSLRIVTTCASDFTVLRIYEGMAECLKHQQRQAEALDFLTRGLSLLKSLNVNDDHEIVQKWQARVSETTVT